MNDNPEKDRLRHSAEALREVIRSAGASFDRDNSIKCPFHDDAHASAGIFKAPNGVWRFKCHKCFGGDNEALDVFDVLSRVKGGKPEDYFPAKDEAKPERIAQFATVEAVKAHLTRTVGTVEAVHQYCHPTNGKPEMIVFRVRQSDGGKTFRQGGPAGNGFSLQAPEKPWPIYNRKRVSTAGDVVVVEGEKCVHALSDIGIVATTSPGGAKKGKHADWQPLKGKRVWLWPDNDSVGREHMTELKTILESLAIEMRWIEPKDLELGEAEDVVDFLDTLKGMSIDDRQLTIRTVMDSADACAAEDSLGNRLEEIIAGKRKTFPFPWPITTALTRALVSGTVTVLCGDPGSGKTFFLTESLIYWTKNGIKVCVLDVAEEDKEFHLNRALAILEGDANLIDTDWIEKHGEETREAHARQMQTTTLLSKRIEASGEEAIPDLKDVLKWVEKKVDEGFDIIVIDPITGAKTGREPWHDDFNFIMRAKSVIRKTGARLVLVTHPRKGSTGKGALSDLAGGAAYQRFAQCVMWLSKPENAKRMTLKGANGLQFKGSCNRLLLFGKTRNGRGGGSRAGFWFDPESLRFAEQGVVIKESRESEQEEA